MNILFWYYQPSEENNATSLMRGRQLKRELGDQGVGAGRRGWEKKNSLGRREGGKWEMGGRGNTFCTLLHNINFTSQGVQFITYVQYSFWDVSLFHELHGCDFFVNVN